MSKKPSVIKPQSAAERKRAQREREAALDIKVVEVKLSASERETLSRLCQVRGGVRGPYDANEFITLLIHRDAQRLDRQLAKLGQCEKCGSQLPGGCDGLFKGDSQCWHTKKARGLEL